MTDNILVCTDGSDYAKTACEYAFYFADLAKANVTAIHVLDSRMLEAPIMADTSGWIGAEPYSDQLNVFREITENKGKAIAEAFSAMAAEKGKTATINVLMGHPPTVIVEEEKKADWVILGQKGEDAQWIGTMTGSTADRVSRHSSKPCLITPQQFAPVQKMLVAFDGSDHARQALIMACEMTKKYGFELNLVTVADGIKLDQAQRIADEGMALAQSYAINTEAIVEEGDAEELILQTLFDLHGDLLVVGAYGHSRIREMILGSTTTHLIARSEVPILLLR